MDISAKNIDKERVSELIEENRKRLDLINSPYNPVTGLNGVGERVEIKIKGAPIECMYLPVKFAETPFIKNLSKEGFAGFIKIFLRKRVMSETKEDLWRKFIEERIKYDFEYWAYSLITIKHKTEPRDVPFKLNRAQRRFLAKLEELRLKGVPIKIILLKARQWGGSTLTQMYMLWIQLVHRANWNSVICGDVEGQSRTVRSMISKALKKYPSWLLDGPVKFTPFEGSSKNKIIQNTNCVVSIGSAQKPDTLRSSDISMAHLTEVGLWQATKGKKPEDLIQSITGSMYDTDCSLLVLESTAKGVGNYFNRTWDDAVESKNNLTPVFVPWFLIDIYSNPIDDYESFISNMDEYDNILWELGATLDAIAWYKVKKKDLRESWRMNSEYPSTPQEAFQSTGRRRFRQEDTIKLKRTCIDPSFIGEITGATESGPESTSNIRLEKEENGNLSIWSIPDTKEHYRDRYIVVVDIGGVSDKADYSDITVFDRYWMIEGGVPEVVAEWHGHMDHDKIAWKAVQIATIYDEALLVIESNTLETEGTEGDNFEYILDEIAQHYPNLYSRTPADKIKQGLPVKWGFHTNSSTKPLVISHQVKAIRDGLYVERCAKAVDEHDTYEIKEDGKTMGAVEGKNDDRLMVRAIGVWVCYQWPLPYKIRQDKARGHRPVSEASI